MLFEGVVSNVQDAIKSINIEFDKIQDAKSDENHVLNIFFPMFIDKSGKFIQKGDDEQFTSYKKFMKAKILDIYQVMKRDPITEGEFAMDYDTAYMRLSSIYNRFKDSHTVVMSKLRLQQGLEFIFDNPVDENNEPLLGQEYDPEKLNPYQRLIVSMLRVFKEDGLRRDGDRVCREVQGTRYWIKRATIEEYIHSSNTRQDVSREMWEDTYKTPGMVKNVADTLSVIHDYEFPDIRRCRHSWSFRNGIYSDGTFYAYNSPEIVKLPDNLVTSRYFPDVDCDPGGATPYFDQIVKYQKWDEETIEFFMAMIGRCCYAVNERDRWQLMPFCYGVAMSGKSTIVTHVVKELYDPEYVGTMSNCVERQFGIGPLSDKFLIIGPEIKRDFSLEQAEWQSMVSGEEIQVASKHVSSRTVKWDVPMFLAGNEMIYQNNDNSGSISRRIVPFIHNERVYAADPMLPDKLKMEMGALIPKFVSSYLRLAERYKNVTVLDHLPKQILEWKKEIAGNLNSLVGFLDSSAVVFGDYIVPESEFVNHYKQWCISVNTTPRKWEKSLWSSCFGERALKNTFGGESETWTNPITGVPQDVHNRHVIRGCNIVHN